VATEKLRAELELITKNAEKDLARLDRSLAGVEKRVKSIGGRGGRSLKPLGDGLSAATANASEFEKSMAAANARVIAFGASAGLIFQVQKALKETVRATVEVEKALTDINIVLGAGSKELQDFGNRLFKVAAQTGQSFKTIAAGATELARQGLGTEKTLKRLNDAMILSRLTGMGAEEAVSSLTAAVNSFNKAGITSAQVVNKMAKVDQAFAVSSDDLAKAISRVGSSAVDAGVSMDELLAITTAVQQRTARGGAVIGNAFKTIFTRIGRTDVQKKLTDIGVATRDMQGQMLPATKVLENLSQKFQTLSQVQQNQIAESVAGVFQVNILRAALGDLSSKYGVYTRAIKESSTATDEAYQKNAQLNQTLDALVNKTLANLTKAGAGIGGATLKPAIENVLGFVNSAIESFGEGGRFEKFGQGIGKDLLKGIGDFIAGPGLAIITYGVGRLLVNFGGFAKQALGGILELNKNVALRKNIEASVTAELQRQPAIIQQIQRGELSAAAAAKDMLAAMKASNLEATKLAVTSRAIASSMMGVPGGMRGMRGAGRADGFVPNFANPNAERAAAAAGGYKAGGIRTMSIPGQGAVMYNSAETVKQFPGMKQPAIMPPQGSLAGSNYQKAFGAAHGFDPYAAGGFVPNFNIGAVLGGTKATMGMTLDQAIKAGLTRQQLSNPKAFGKEAVDAKLGVVSEGGKPVTKGTQDVIRETMDVKKQLGIVSLYGSSKGVKQAAKSSMKLKNLAVFREYVARNPKAGEERIQFTGVQVATLKGLEERVKKKGGGKTFSDSLNDHILEPLARVGAETIGGVLGNQGPRIDDIKREMRGKDLVPRQSEGELFETAIKLALHDKKRFIASIDGSPTAPFDFEEGKAPSPEFKTKLGFHENLVRADAKRTSDKAAVDSVIKKAYNQHVLIEAQLAKGPLLKELGALPLVGKIDQSAAAKRLGGTASKRPGRAYGLVPNFSPLGDAITRERAAGVPASAIRVGSSPALKGPSNPGGLGVYNTIDEPAGLGQGISRSRRMGINPKSHGVPNFSDKIKIDMPSGYVMPGTTDKGIKSAGGLDLSDNTKAVKENTEIQKKTLSERVKGGFAKMGPTAGMLLPTAGFMMAPAIEKKYGLDSAGVQGATMLGMGGVMGAGAAFGLGGKAAGLLGMSSLAGPIGVAAAGLLIGGSALIGYNMMKTPDEEKEREKKFAELAFEKEEFQTLANAISALSAAALELSQNAEGFTDEQKQDRFVQLRLMRDKARQAGTSLNIPTSEIDAIYDAALKGDPEAAARRLDLISKEKADIERSEQMLALKATTDKFANQFRSAETQVQMDFDPRIRASLGPEFENMMPGQRTERFKTEAYKNSRFFKDYQKALARQLELTIEGLLAEGEMGEYVDEQERILYGLGTRGKSSRLSLIQGEMMSRSGEKGFKRLLEGGYAEAPQEFRKKFREAAKALVEAGELSQEYFDSLFGQNIPERLAQNITQRARFLMDEEELSEGEKEILNKRATVYRDLTDLNKQFVSSILNDSRQIQRARAELNAAFALDMSGIKDARTLDQARVKSNINLSGIRGGDRAALMFQRDDAIFGVEASTQREFERQRQELNRKQKRDLGSVRLKLQQDALSGLAKAAGMGGSAELTAYSPTPVLRGSATSRRGRGGAIIPTMFGEQFGTVVSVNGVLQRPDIPRLSPAVLKARDELGRIKDAPEDPEKLVKFLQDRVVNLSAIKGLSSQELDAVKKQISALNEAIKVIEDGNAAKANLPELQRRSVELQKQLIDFQLEELEARKVFQPGQYRKAVADELRMAESTVIGLDQMQAEGFGVTGAAKGAAAGRARRARIAAGQGFQGLGGMRDAFSYNANDAALEFDAAMVDFGQTVKDSTKGAIKDIISGAKSFEDAMYNVFATLADKIATQGINQGVDSIFGSLFGRRHGGKIPGYNQGGVVTGGSGVRDDVLTMMQGGEYVIKKSSAQKIGYGTLNAINGYANGGKARVSLAKEFLFTGDDPRRPTGGRYNVSRNLSTAAIFRENDPQTDRMFGRQETMVNYQEYRRAEQARRDKILDNIKRQKRARLMNAYISAGLRIGAGFLPKIGGGNPAVGADGNELGVQGGSPGDYNYIEQQARGGSPALLMGGEYVMSPRTTAKYGTGFMAELNRGKVPGYAQGGMVGGGGTIGSGLTTNNVNLAINIDKSGDTQVETQESSSIGQDKESQEVENSKKFADAIRAAVQKEITHQQRPGGLLRDGASYAGGRRI